MQIGYSDRHNMRWYHLGCLGADKWEEASMPGRLTGLSNLHPSQQVLRLKALPDAPHCARPPATAVPVSMLQVSNAKCCLQEDIGRRLRRSSR